LLTARERFADGRFRVLFLELVLFRLAFFAAVPLRGILTPARRALDKPIAIACSVDLAPCLPSRT